MRYQIRAASLTRDTFRIMYHDVTRRRFGQALVGPKEGIMSRDIREGRWLQLRGRIKRACGSLFGNEPMVAEGAADVLTGTLQESFGVAKKQAAREVER